MENKNFEEKYAALTDEQKEKISDCKTPEEMTVLLGELGIELPDELLDAVAGGQEGNNADQGPGMWHVGPSGSYWHGHSREWYECSKCGGCIIPGQERMHICKQPERR